MLLEWWHLQDVWGDFHRFTGDSLSRISSQFLQFRPSRSWIVRTSPSAWEIAIPCQAQRHLAAVDIWAPLGWMNRKSVWWLWCYMSNRVWSSDVYKLNIYIYIYLYIYIYICTQHVYMYVYTYLHLVLYLTETCFQSQIHLHIIMTIYMCIYICMYLTFIDIFTYSNTYMCLRTFILYIHVFSVDFWVRKNIENVWTFKLPKDCLERGIAVLKRNVGVALWLHHDVPVQASARNIHLLSHASLRIAFAR